MPRFNKAERTVLIEVAETFAGTTADRNVKAQLTSAIRKLRESGKHHDRMDEQKGARS